MAEPAKSPLAKLREVQERAAARTARIDQLQAAVASSRSRSQRFFRTLLIVGYASVIAATLLRLKFPAQGALDAALAAAAIGLVLLALFSRAAIHRFVEGRSFLGEFGSSAIARWIARSPAWELSATTLGSRTEFARRRYLTVLLALAAVLVALVWKLGSVAPAALALALVIGLLRLTWSRRISTPAEIQYGAMLVALLAMVSTSFWVGDLVSGLTHPALAGRERAAPAASAPAREVRRPAPTYATACPARAPWSGSKSTPALRLGEAWLAAGASLAGCSGPIRETSRGSGVVVSEGVAFGAMRSLGVADRNRAALLTGQPARVTASLLTSHGLVGVPMHLTVGDDNLYLVDTKEGTYVLARQRASGAPAGRGYATLPPALADLWVDAMSRGGGWLWPIRSTYRLGGESYLFAGTDRAIVARGKCEAGSGSCALSYSGSTAWQTGGRWISAEQVLRYAPSF